jgi:hypothetical protein
VQTVKIGVQAVERLCLFPVIGIVWRVAQPLLFLLQVVIVDRFHGVTSSTDQRAQKNTWEPESVMRTSAKSVPRVKEKIRADFSETCKWTEGFGTRLSMRAESETSWP